MHLHEYQTKTLLKEYGIDSPPFFLIRELADLEPALKILNASFVKVQIHAGGRGKAGGVVFAKNPDEIKKHVKNLLGKKIVNAQTGPLGMPATTLILTPAIEIEHEYYLAAMIDRPLGRPVILASRFGGMEIEEHATTVCKEPMTLQGRLHSYQLLTIAKAMGWEGALKKEGIEYVKRIARAFVENEATLLELNPLVVSGGRFLALDAKMTIDDQALFRHAPLALLNDETQITENERIAKRVGLSYVALQGEVGCMVNGAGLAMATMDLIHHLGGRPANFLDVGGSASFEKIAEGFRIIAQDRDVKAIFVNIFGGIVDCGVLAGAIVKATLHEKLTLPLIVRLEGTNVEEGRRILRESNLAVITANTMREGAEKALQAARSE